MKILHIVAEISVESGVAVVATRLAVEQQNLAHEVCVASTEKRKVLKFESSKVLKCCEKLETGNLKLGETLWSGADHKLLNVEHSTSAFANTATADRSNIEHRTGVRVVTFRRSWPHFLFFSWGMLLGLGKMVKDVDVVHVHSNWTFPVWWGAWLALRQKKTLVMSPHGCFDPVRLEHSGWKKALVGWMDRWLLRRASVVHATCEAENAWIQAFLKLETGNLKLGGALRPGRPRIVVIPNGVG
jgi:glycosyltransferase involved in cell wall biosynthesis